MKETVKQVFYPADDDVLVVECRDKLAQALAEFGVRDSWAWSVSCRISNERRNIVR